MKFFNWMQNKLIGGNKNSTSVPSINHTEKDPPKDWPDGLLAIGTLGNIESTNEQRSCVQISDQSQSPQRDDHQCSSPDFSEFTGEEVNQLQKQLKKLLTRKPVDHPEPVPGNLPLDRFLNCPSSLEVDRTASNHFTTYSDSKDEEEINRTIRIIIGRCKDVCEKKKSAGAIGKKSLCFLVKKMFACRSGFAPMPSLLNTFQESRMEKLMRTMLTKKIYPQNASRASSTKKRLGDYQHKINEIIEDENTNERSKWDKTDSEYIVLDIENTNSEAN